MVINAQRNTNRVHCNLPESVEDQFGPRDIPYDDKTSSMFLYIENHYCPVKICFYKLSSCLKI